MPVHERASDEEAKSGDSGGRRVIEKKRGDTKTALGRSFFTTARRHETQNFNRVCHFGFAPRRVKTEHVIGCANSDVGKKLRSTSL